MSENMHAIPQDTVALAAEIVSAYVRNNSLPVSEVPALIRAVHGSVSALQAGGTLQTGESAAAETRKATTQEIKRSITAEQIISFEDGRGYKTLKRHLAKHGLTPDSYRAKWGLPSDYPMTSQAYSQARSSLAKAIGLGVGGHAQRAAA